MSQADKGGARDASSKYDQSQSNGRWSRMVRKNRAKHAPLHDKRTDTRLERPMENSAVVGPKFAASPPLAGCKHRPKTHLRKLSHTDHWRAI